MKINLIGLSGGKDSTALLGWAIHESGYPRESIVATFSDTENEYDEVYEQIEKLDKYCVEHGVKPIVRLRAAGKWTESEHPLFLALAIWKNRFPSAKARFCTDFLKIRPTKAYITELQKAGHEVITHSGVRASESVERSMMKEWSDDMFGCQQRRPLLQWSISDVWNAHRKWGLPINQLYMDGWKRVGCRLCIMSNKNDVRRTVVKRPWVIELYSKWELIVGKSCRSKGSVADYSTWFHRKTVPLAQRSRVVDTKQGPMKVATMDDVARWSTTSRGGVQQLADFMLEEEKFDVDDAHGPCKSGMCE